jgi:probable LLM family oxidoreductase
MEIGITTFGETYPDPHTGELVSHGERIRQLIDEAVLAEQVGLDYYGIGEHHRSDFAVSSPATVLAAIAARTSRIRLSPAVSVLSSDDPVRVYQQYATVDLISEGRVELMVGRGSFIESFPLFGYSLHDYEELFSEKLDLLLEIRQRERISWTGRHRADLLDQPVYPRAAQNPLPVWVAVGGTPPSVVRAAERGLPLALAIIGGAPERFSALTQIHRRTLLANGFNPNEVPIAVHGHGFVGTDDEETADWYYPYYEPPMSRIGHERGFGEMTRYEYERMRGPNGSLVLGSPETVAAKILHWRRVLGVSRFMLHMSVGTMPHDDVLACIERLGREVAPLVRAQTQPA